MEKTDEYKEAMGLLFSAKWNVPQAAKHCGVGNKECKEMFRQYCLKHPVTYKDKKSRKKIC
jgi:hypothetical protein